MKMLFVKFKGNSGQSMVELAIILPVLLLLIFGIVEFGRVFSSYLFMTNLARNAARYGVVGHTDVEIHSQIDVDNLLLDSEVLMVEISPDDSTRQRGEALTVTLNYSVKIISPIMSDFLPNPFPLVTSCSMMVE